MSMMRTATILLAALAAVILVSSTVCLAADDRQASNIAPNPSAEKAGANNLPEGWSYYQNTNTPAGAGMTEKVRHSGDCSTFLKVTDFDEGVANTGLAVGLTTGYKGPKAIPVKPNTKYYFSFYIKGEGFTRKVTVRPWTFKADGGGRDHKSIPGVKVVPTDKWTHHVGSFTTGAEVERLVLMFYVWGKKDRDIRPGAIFYVDDVYLGVSEAGAKAEVPAGSQPKPTTRPAGPVRIWDVGKKYKVNYFALYRAFKHKDIWKQVPHGKVDYKFQGDIAIENDFLYMGFTAVSQDAIYYKRKGQAIAGDILYRCRYTKQIKLGGLIKYAGRAKYVRILKNTPDEVIVEHHGKRGKHPIVTTYRIVKDKPWVQVRSAGKSSEKAHMLGLHGKLRIGLIVVEDGNDFVVDSLRDPAKRYAPPKGRLVIGFREAIKTPFMYVMTFPDFAGAHPYFYCDSGPGGDTMWCAQGPGKLGGLETPRKWDGCITATYVRFANQKAPVVIGAPTHLHNWHRDHPDRPIKKGQVYTSKWKPPYPGRWRMTVRIAEKKYDQGFKYDGKTKFPAKYFSKDVYDGNFTFRIPIDGHLDYVIMYLYDRTKDTPAGILTPMDQYRWTVGKK